MYIKVCLIVSLLCFYCVGTLSAQPVGVVHEGIRTQAKDKPKKITLNVEQYNGLLKEDSLSKNENDSLKIKIDDLYKEKDACEKKLDSLRRVMNNMPPLTNIQNSSWMIHNLTENELYIYFGLTQIKKVVNKEEWDEAFSKNEPAFCYHKLDKENSQGILLNVEALKIFRNKIAKDSLFRLPIKADFEALNALAKLLNKNALQMLGSSSGLVKWEVKGGTMDLFGFNMLPLSYRRSLEGDEWQGGNSASIFCEDPNNRDMSKGIQVAEISSSNPNWDIMPRMSINGAYGNIGVYVRLLYR